MIFGPDGALYGTTLEGGSSGYGVIFRLAPYPNPCETALCRWNETVLYAFTGNAAGAGPSGNLLFDQAGNIYGTTQAGGSEECRIDPLPTIDANGNLYGTTWEGGAGSCYAGCGVVWEITP